MPKANSFGKIAKRILILHSRANKLQADLLALESLVTTEAKKAEKGAVKVAKAAPKPRKAAASKTVKTAARGAARGAAPRAKKPAAK